MCLALSEGMPYTPIGLVEKENNKVNVNLKSKESRIMSMELNMIGISKAQWYRPTVPSGRPEAGDHKLTSFSE